MLEYYLRGYPHQNGPHVRVEGEPSHVEIRLIDATSQSVQLKVSPDDAELIAQSILREAAMSRLKNSKKTK